MPNAITPDYFKEIRVLTKKEDEAPIQEKEEIALSDMSLSGGWKVLSEYIDDLKESLDQLLKSAMENGASYEEIGQKTIVTTLTKSYLDKVVERVEDARTAIESAGK